MKTPIACVCTGTTFADPINDSNVLAETVRAFRIK